MTLLSVTFEEISGREIKAQLSRVGDVIQVESGGRHVLTLRRDGRRSVRIEMHAPFAEINDATLRAWAAKRCLA